MKVKLNTFQLIFIGLIMAYTFSAFPFSAVEVRGAIKRLKKHQR